MTVEQIKKIIGIIMIPFVWIAQKIKEHHDFWEVALTALAICIAYVLYVETQKQTKTQERFSKIEMRAYIGFDSVVTRDFKFVIGQKGDMPYSITNVGGTPAYNVIATSKFKYGEVTQKDFDAVQYPDTGGATMGIEITRTYHASTESPVTSEDTLKVYKSIHDKSLTLFIYGVIWYKDVFDTPHWTRYCVGRSAWRGKKIFFDNPEFNDCDHNE
jgi:hypothetical protein